MRLAIAGGVLVLAAACTGAPATSIPPAPSAAASASAATSAPAGSAPAAAAACTAPAATMVELTEGPYYKAGAPQRTALLRGEHRRYAARAHRLRRERIVPADRERQA
jgi:hypothetical protein